MIIKEVEIQIKNNIIRPIGDFDESFPRLIFKCPENVTEPKMSRITRRNLPVVDVDNNPLTLIGGKFYTMVIDRKNNRVIVG